MNYQEIDNIKLYLRKNLLENYLTEEEKEMLKKKFPLAKRYILTSEDICEIERNYMQYEERVFISLCDKKVLIKKDGKGIVIFIEEPKEVFKLELKKYIKQQNISIRPSEQECNDKLIRLENANKIGEEIF